MILYLKFLNINQDVYKLNIFSLSYDVFLLLTINKPNFKNIYTIISS